MKDGERPWQVAAKLLPELERASATNMQSLISSAWVIVYAHEEFTKGVEIMEGLKQYPSAEAEAGFGYLGNRDGLVRLTNGILRDDRAFVISRPDWIAMYTKQVAFEYGCCQAWLFEGLETIKGLAQKRLKEKGWNNLRPALSVTVRAAIMRASIDGNLRQEPQAGVHYLRRALDLLEWGRSIWENVPGDDRGEIFEDTFVIGVRGMYLKVFSEAYYTDPGLNSKFPLEHLKKEAEDLLKETELAPTLMKEKVDPGFLLSFINYPAGIAHSMIGLYHVEMAQYCADPRERMSSFMNGSRAYLLAAGEYPVDDELHPLYLNRILDLMGNAGGHVSDFITVADHLRELAPKMRKIWAVSALAQGGRDQRIQANLDRARDFMKRVAEGTLMPGNSIPLS
ncbi:hypothetical protein AZE42_09878 [Rhizopogon vesiculosus]|uniref:Uncharacterized protein n=1 Tax=Rhizopogon vesiculosus TaxID=180088 RepID=A0A1J8Q6G0_9AGAM|nr:hypothetical protein AZE42_09878 [Rhizopogon vesiculosus]